MARIAKPAANTATAAAKPAKVAKLDKAAKGTATDAKPAKAPKADKADATPKAPRGQFATGKLRVTAEGKAATLRGGRAARLALVRSLDGRPMAEVLGAAYRIEGEAADRTLNSGNLAVFADKGFIEIV